MDADAENCLQHEITSQIQDLNSASYVQDTTCVLLDFMSGHCDESCCRVNWSGHCVCHFQHNIAAPSTTYGWQSLKLEQRIALRCTRWRGMWLSVLLMGSDRSGDENTVAGRLVIGSAGSRAMLQRPVKRNVTVPTIRFCNAQYRAASNRHIERSEHWAI
jgi:hypothetical protein